MSGINKVFWIASYPKSGNTWVRFIVSSILQGRPVEQSGEIDALTPDIHKSALADLPQDRDVLYLKTHWACTPKTPLYDQAAGAIYVVRHPGDVLISNLRYLNVSKKKWPEYVEQFINLGGMEHWTHFGMGSWLENLQSWTNGAHGFPVLTVTYESLLKSPADGVREIARHINVPISSEQAEHIVQKTSFSKLKAMELRERKSAPEGTSFFKGEASGDPKGKRVFMRSGKSRQYLSVLNAQQKVGFARRFGPTIEKYGLDA